MWKHHVVEGEGELKARRDLDERGAEPAGDSLARAGPPGVSYIFEKGTSVPVIYIGTRCQDVCEEIYFLASYFGIRFFANRYLVTLFCCKVQCQVFL